MGKNQGLATLESICCTTWWGTALKTPRNEVRDGYGSKKKKGGSWTFPFRHLGPGFDTLGRGNFPGGGRRGALQGQRGWCSMLGHGSPGDDLCHWRLFCPTGPRERKLSFLYMGTTCKGVPRRRLFTPCGT